MSFDVPYDRHKTADFRVEFSVRHAAGSDFADAGEAIAWYQFPLAGQGVTFPDDPVPPCGDLRSGDSPSSEETLRLEETPSGWRIAGSGFEAELDRALGVFSCIRVDGAEWVRDVAIPCFTRPHSGVDGQEGWARNRAWRRFAPDATVRSLRSLQVEPAEAGRIRVRSVAAFAFDDHENGAVVETRMCLGPDRRVEVDMIFVVDPVLGDLPRVGAAMVVEAGFETLLYWGLGPRETYPDRKIGARLAVFQTRVTDSHFPFEPPSECGGREETRWFRLGDETGRQVLFSSAIPFHFDARHSSIGDYRNATHDRTLIRREETFVHIDAAHAGIGGDMGWSTFLDTRDRVPAGAYRLSFSILLGS